MSLVSGMRSGVRSALRSGMNPSEGAGASASLSVAISDSADPVMTLASYSYAVVVTVSTADATNLVCDVQLDADTTYVSGSGTGWSVTDLGSGHIQATRATGSVGVQPTITIDVTSPAAAETSSATADADADNSNAATQDTETTTIKLVSKDATSGIRVPNDATQEADWITCTGLATAQAASAWLCQEASGNLAGFGSAAFTLTATGATVYNQAVAGWTRTGVQGVDAGTVRFSAAAGVGPSVATTSQVWFVFALMPASPAAVRSCVGLNVTSSTDSVRFQHQASGIPRLQADAVNVDGGTSVSSTFEPLVLKFDRANDATLLYTHAEKITGTHSDAVNDGAKGFCNGSAMIVVYAYVLTGADAEACTDAAIKARLQAHGFTIPWS